MKLIVFLLTTASVTNIITKEYIFYWVHAAIEKKFPNCEWLNTLINCPTCMGFWVGVAFCWLLPMPWLIVAPFMSSITCKIIDIWEKK